jgi:hypothetical protein
VLVPPPPELDASLIDSLLPRDSILAIDDPHFLPAEDAARFMTPDERVIGLVINGEARAYPIPILSVHEIVNDIVGDEPVAITWCPLCYTALVFSRKVEGEPQSLTFGVSGKLLYETLVMFDRNSESLWSQLYGVALDGPLEGSRLSFFPSTFTEWQAWLEQYPDTLVLDKEATCARFQCGTYSSNPRGSYQIDPYESYYNTRDEGVVNRQIPRDTNQALGTAKDRVLGVRIAGRSVAYPYGVLAAQSLINDVIGDVPVVVWFDNGSQTGLAHLRLVDDLTLTFSIDTDSEDLLIDEETGSRWDAFTGTAIDGPLKGTRLPPLVTTSAFAFGWYDYFPDSDTYSVK